MFRSDIPFGFWFIGSQNQGLRQYQELKKIVGRVPLNNMNFMTGFGLNSREYSDKLSGSNTRRTLYPVQSVAKKDVKNEYDQIIPFTRLG